MSVKSKKSLIDKLKKEADKIAASRDKLREIIGDYEDIIYDSAEASDRLDEAIAILSQRL